MQRLIKQAKREWLVLVRQGSDWLQPLLLFALIVVLFPMGLQPSAVILRVIAPGVIWIGALLANLMLLGRVFHDDFRSGVVLHHWLSSRSLLLYVWLKVAVRCVFFVTPLLALTPVMAMFYGVSDRELVMIPLSLLSGAPAMVWLTAMLSAMALTARQSEVMQTVLLLPLCVPLLIFGAAQPASSAALLFLAALSMAAMAVAPAVTAWLLRQQLGYG